ncbi:MAG: alpha/beta hydrolase [Pedobacter sp.]|nr:MAG: alpha/beta hydrolase [Pedobacter sp.]
MAIFNKSFYLSILVTMLFFCSSYAQKTYHFTSGLAVNAGAKYGREVLYTDPVAYGLFTKSLKTPTDGQTLIINSNGAEVKWVRITADTLNRFRSRGAANSYLYFNYNATSDGTALLNILGNSSVFVNSIPHMGDPYGSGWMNIPIKLKKGNNDFFVRGTNIAAKLIFPEKPVTIDISDATIPNIVVNKSTQNLTAAVVIINGSAKPLLNYQLTSELSGKILTTKLPDVPALSTRKIYFNFNTELVKTKGMNEVVLSLVSNGTKVDSKILNVESVNADEKYAKTFISEIDGSLQYYAVSPQVGGEKPGSALFFSVHGAGVEAIGQAKAYQSKDWGTLVTPTNRRPRGFNWEDWGRLDALEVLALAKQQLNPDPKNIYLTGHSMGGHGTWFLGATYPDKWAAIAPCAGYPTLKGYGSADGLIPDSAASAIGQILLRASNQSDVPKLAFNYKQLGVYILHGDADRTVSVNYARQMKQQLAGFHSDISYYEYPGGSHWYGDHSVDWKPIFDFFKWHTLKNSKDANVIDFTTASPGISAANHWITIHQQINPLQYSRIQINRDLNGGNIKGITNNVHLLKIGLSDFKLGTGISILLDSLNSIAYTVKNENDSVFLAKGLNEWKIIGDPQFSIKGPHRYGTFKDGFNKRMVYVYGTGGSIEEKEWSINKARFDAESWYYRGNGSFDIVADKDYRKSKYAGRNVVLIGSSETNSAWKTLLADCPIKVGKGKIHAGNKTFTGDDLGTYFVWPIAGTSNNSVSVIAGSGILGMNAVTANQYFTGGSGFPDIMIYRISMLKDGIDGVEYAGFFDNNWKINDSNIISKTK